MLTCGWNHAAERPRPGGAVVPQIFVQVKLSKRELTHSLGISCTAEWVEKMECPLKSV